MNTIITHPKTKTKEWLIRAMKATGLKASVLITALLEQEAEKVLSKQITTTPKATEQAQQPNPR